MEEARKRKFDVIVVWRFDRFARSTKHLLLALEEFRSLGIQFISYQENIDTSSPLGQALFTIVSAVAQLERDLIENAMNKAEIRKQLELAFKKHLNIPRKTVTNLVPSSITEGKLYEAYVLSKIVAKLVDDEGFSLVLVGGAKLKLKSAPGPINRSYPYIELHRYGNCVAELWTDVEFLTLSYSRLASPPLTKGSYHELDIVVVDAGSNGRPPHDAVWLGIECKNTSYQKGLLKEILGVRRELSLVTSDPIKTKFSSWPRPYAPANPPSCLVVFARVCVAKVVRAVGSFYRYAVDNAPERFQLLCRDEPNWRDKRILAVLTDAQQHRHTFHFRSPC